MPTNIIQHPNGATSQYWPADMRNDILQSIKSTPPVFPMESTGYGYYTSYSTKHKNGPLTFPPAPEQEKNNKAKVEPQMKTIAKLPSITKPATFTHWDGHEQLASGQENLYREGPDPKTNSAYDYGFVTPPQQYYIAATVNPYRDYNNFVRDCYHLNPGQYRFNVRPTPEMMEIADALSNGNIRLVKDLAARLQEPQQVNYTILFPIVPANQREVFPAPTELARPPLASSNNTTLPVSTRPSVYLAPNKMRYIKKRINRRPKPLQRQVIGLTTTTTTSTTEVPPQMIQTETTQQPAIPTTTQAQWEPMGQPVAAPQRRRLVKQRRTWYG